MRSDKENLIIITNLYPLPWEPNRATFNRQQFAQLDDEFTKSVLVPVAFPDWFKNRKLIKPINKGEHLRFVPYFYLPKFGRRFYSIFLFLSILLHAGFWLKKKKPKIMLASWAFPEAVATRWLSRLFKCRFYFKVHGSDINLHGKVPARAKQIVNAAKNADGILSVSKALASEMINMGIESEKINVIYNGVDHQLFGQNYSTPFDEPYILFVGNLKKEKGVEELLTGFAKISIEYPSLNLVYAGSGVMKATLVKQAKTLGLNNKVQLLGNVNHADLPALISNAKLLALPSYNEGVPNVVLEAMACGTPVLATNVGGIPEVVDKNLCGKLIPAKDEAAVAQGLKFILSHSWSRQAIKQHSKQFSWENNKKQLVSLLQQTTP